MLLNERQFFEAHEALEDAWREEPGEIRVLYQGILQVAVVYLHIQRGNYEGALRVAARCKPKLESYPAACRGVEVAQLLRDFTAALDVHARLGSPHIQDFDHELFKPIKYQL